MPLLMEQSFFSDRISQIVVAILGVGSVGFHCSDISMAETVGVTVLVAAVD